MITPENDNHQIQSHEMVLKEKSLSQLEDGEGNLSDTNDGVSPDNRRHKKGLLERKSFKKIAFGALIILILLLVVAYLLYTYLPYNESVTVGKFSDNDIPNPVVEQGPSASTLHVFSKAAVCSDSGICSKIGRDILQRGGNVVDSALATIFCNGIVTMQSLGIGGGSIMNVFKKSENTAYTIDAREVAPIAATEDMFTKLFNNASLVGPLSIAVPGEVMGYHEAFKRFGSMPWKDLIEPSIKVCENGFPLSKHMWDALHLNKMAIKDERLKNSFLSNETNEIHKIGTKIFPPKELCETYKKLSKNGAEDFYQGELSELIAKDLEEIGSIITINDLKVYRADVIHSISVKINNDTMFVVPPVGSGTIVANIINILRGYNFTSDNIKDDASKELTYHRMAEAFKFSFAKRFQLGDLRFNRGLNELITNLTSPEFGDRTRKLIDDDKTFDDMEHYDGKFWEKSDNGTSHLSIVSENGDAVAVTSTINYYFGCGITGRRTGIIFNSGMEDFSKPNTVNYFGLPSARPNLIKPRKRPMSSMTPTIITDQNGDVKLVIGSAGGTKIPTSVAQIIVRVLWFGEDIKQAIDAARIHHQLYPNQVVYEYGVTTDIIEGLEKRGHKTWRYKDRGSTMCGIMKNSTAIYANADYRKAGEAVGI